MPVKVTKKVVSPNRNSPRNHAVDTFTPHCTVGQVSAQWLADYFSQPSVGASCNWGIGTEGDFSDIVPEGDRSWCSSSAANDNRAITVECASDAFYPYAINAKVWVSLVELGADVCRRYGKTKMVWLGDKAKSLAYNPKPDEMLVTVHRWFANKSCPGDYMYNRMGQIVKEINQKLAGEPAEPFKAYQGQVDADDGLNCRTSPVSGSVLKTYPDGTVVTITKECGGWGYTGEGWVCLDYIIKIASAKDPAAKEDIIMEGKLIDKIVREILDQKYPVYHKLEDVPAYWREDIKALVDAGIIKGTGGDVLDLTRSEARMAVLIKRAMEKQGECPCAKP